MCTDPATRWDAFGNMQADAACKQALAADMSVVREMVDSTARQMQQQRQQLQLVYTYLVELHGLSNRQLNGPNFAATAEDSSEPPALSMQAPVVQTWIQARTQLSPVVALPMPADKVFKSSSWGIPFSWRV